MFVCLLKWIVSDSITSLIIVFFRFIWYNPQLMMAIGKALFDPLTIDFMLYRTVPVALSGGNMLAMKSGDAT